MFTEFIGVDFLILIRFFVLAFLVLYVLFALVIVRQVRLMSSTLDVGFEGPIKFLSLVHLAFAIAVAVYALTTL